MSEENIGSSAGIGFCGALFITFLVLKLVGVIDWSWIWIFAPLWIPVVSVILIFGAFFTAAVIDNWKYTKETGEQKTIMSPALAAIWAEMKRRREE